jgi:hypothetical protein
MSSGYMDDVRKSYHKEWGNRLYSKGLSYNKVLKDMNTKFFRQEYRGFYIMQVHWSHPEIGEKLKHFTMEEIDGRWAGHTIGAKMTVQQCEQFIDQLIDWRNENLKVETQNED